MNPCEGNITKVSKLQRYVLVHSYLYYELDRPVITDKKYDEESTKLLNELFRISERELLKTDYGYAFVDYDGCSGYDLYEKLFPCDQKKIATIANHVLRAYK